MLRKLEEFVGREHVRREHQKKKKKTLHQSLLSLQHQQDELWTLKDGELPIVKFISVLRVESCTSLYDTEPFRGWMSQWNIWFNSGNNFFFVFYLNHILKPRPHVYSSNLRKPQQSRHLTQNATFPWAKPSVSVSIITSSKLLTTAAVWGESVFNTDVWGLDPLLQGSDHKTLPEGKILNSIFCSFIWSVCKFKKLWKIYNEFIQVGLSLLSC